MKLKVIRGKELDALALQYGVTRLPRRWFWPLKESDKNLRFRLLCKMITGR